MNIFVGNISQQMDEINLRELFAEFGPVTSVKIAKDFYTGKFRGLGFVEMQSDLEAHDAIRSLNNKMFFGKRIRVIRREE